MGETSSCDICKKKFELYPKNDTRKICKQCLINESGPSYADIRNCTHMAMSLEESKRLLRKNSSHNCECKEGERGWTDFSGKRTLAPGKHSVPRVSKKGNLYWEHDNMKQDKVVHTQRWDEIKQLKIYAFFHVLDNNTI